MTRKQTGQELVLRVACLAGKTCQEQEDGGRQVSHSDTFRRWVRRTENAGSKDQLGRTDASHAGSIFAVSATNSHPCDFRT